jgi:hypothetical protein
MIKEIDGWSRKTCSGFEALKAIPLHRNISSKYIACHIGVQPTLPFYLDTILTGSVQQDEGPEYGLKDPVY